jgi:HPt (histidine-containing phosphotransfer) domain-containing protein
MNELQVKITADIANLQSALNKVEKTLKQFGENAENSTDGFGEGLKRDIGLIEKLEIQARSLRKSIREATSTNEIEKYNQELEQTIIEMTRLNALGRTFTDSQIRAANATNSLAQSQGNANGVALEFSRIIQDSPYAMNNFGAIANNLQQLSSAFTQTSTTLGGAGAAIRASLLSLISPANLLVLGISAVTAAYTAYQMGAFDFLKSTEEATDGVEKYNEELENTIKNLSAFEKVSLNTSNGIAREKIQLDSLFAILKDTNLNQETRIGAYNKLVSLYPNLLKGLTQEKALTADLTKEYNLLSEAIGKKALASALEGELIDSYKEQFNIQKQLNVEKNEQVRIEDELLKALLKEEKQARFVRGANADGLALKGQQLEVDRSISKELEDQLDKQIEIVSLTEKLLKAQGTEAENLKARLTEVQKEVFEINGEFGQTDTNLKNINTEAEKLKRTFEDIKNLPQIGLPDENREDLVQRLKERLNKINKGGKVEVTGQEFIDAEIAKVQAKGINLSLPVEELSQDAEKIIDINELIGSSYNALSNQIVNNLGIANNGLRAFIGTILSSAPKIIQAINAQASAKKLADAKTIAGNAQVAGSEAIASGAKAANALGPIGLALLPVFIGGALAIISGAFSKIGGSKGGVSGGGGGGVSAGGGVPSTFTNANASVPNSFNPDLAGFGSGFSTSGGKLTAEVSGDSLIFVLERAQEKRSRS